MRVTLKLATSLDGRIATASGESQWITGEAARAQGHRLRAEHDAVLVGVETVLADDPQLTVRLLPSFAGEGDREAVGGQVRPGFPPGSALQREAAPPSDEPMEGRQPLRVILDSRLRTPPAAKVAAAGTLILTTSEPRLVGGAEVEQAGSDGRPSPAAVLAALDRRDIASLLIEGGGEVAASFLRAGLVNRLEWFRAPILLGAEGRPCVAALALAKLGDAPKFRRTAAEPLGEDLWERYEAVR